MHCCLPSASRRVAFYRRGSCCCLPKDTHQFGTFAAAHRGRRRRGSEGSVRRNSIELLLASQILKEVRVLRASQGGGSGAAAKLFFLAKNLRMPSHHPQGLHLNARRSHPRRPLAVFFYLVFVLDRRTARRVCGERPPLLGSLLQRGQRR